MWGFCLAFASKKGLIKDMQDTSPQPNAPSPTAHTGRHGVHMGQALVLAAPSLGLAAVGLPLAVQLPDFYANSMQMSVGIVGIVFMLVRLFDIVLDPFIGRAMDLTSTGIGRFRPWLLFSMLPLLAGIGLVFFNIPGPMALPRLVIGLILIYFGFSAGVIAQTGWMATLPRTARPHLYGLWQAGNILGILLILAVPAVVQLMGLGREGAVWYMGMGLALIIPLSSLPAVFLLRDGTEGKRPPAGRHKGSYKLLLKRWDVLRLMGIDLATGFAAGCLGALFQIQFGDRLGFEKLAGAMLLFYFLCGMIGLPAWSFIARRWGEYRSLFAALTLSLVGLMLVPLIAPNAVVMAFVILGVSGLAYAAPAFLIRSEAARIAQDLHDQQKIDCEASMLALATMTAKLGYALAVGVAYLALQAINYRPETWFRSHRPETLEAVGILFVVLPTIGYVLAVICLLSQRKARHAA